MELDVLKNAIKLVLQVYEKEIDIESTFECDLGADSIDMMQIIKCASDELDIEMEPTDFMDVKTVGDALDVIKKYTTGEEQ